MMAKYLILVALLIHGIVAPPVLEKTTPKPKAEDVPLGLEYEHYLKEVISHLESDKDFRKQLESANATEIQDGSIARHLQFVSHNVRSKLDEVKRKEIERLRDLAIAEARLKESRGIKSDKIFQMPLHVDLKDIKFTEADLKKLIQQTTKDLEEADKDREKEFKNYEMEKEHLRREKLRHTKNEEERKKIREEYEEMRRKHRDHEKFKHPGSKDQLEEVWEETDKMEGSNFDPRTFFNMHDVNNDGFLDQGEVEALFQKELDKAYDSEKPEDDMMERYEEMNRMRQHVFKEFDTNNDWLISWDEFRAATQTDDFKKPKEEFKGLDEEDVFNENDFKEFEELHTMPPQEVPTRAPTPAPTSSVSLSSVDSQRKH